MSGKKKSKHINQEFGSQVDQDTDPIVEDISDNLDDALGKIATALKKKAGTNKEVGQIIAQVIVALGPVLTQTVTAVVHNHLERNKGLENELCKIKRDNLIISEKLERLEQYTRKDQVKIFGIPSQIGSDSENTDELVGKLGKHWFWWSHRRRHRCVTQAPGASRSRSTNHCKIHGYEKRDKFMKMAKEKLKTEKDSNIFVTENLTPERAKLLRKLKQREDIKKGV